ncbi:hypothetical protein GCM10027610_104670 [Dactylosporangium cerinum]
MPFGLTRTMSRCIAANGAAGSPAAVTVASVSWGMTGGRNAGAIRADPVVVTAIGSP